MNRTTRLLHAKRCPKFSGGKNGIKRYAKWFGVDKLCALTELRMLGVEISEEEEAKIRQGIADKTAFNLAAKKRRLANKNPKNEMPLIESNYHFAYIAGYTSNGVPFGITHEEMEAIEGDE